MRNPAGAAIVAVKMLRAESNVDRCPQHDAPTQFDQWYNAAKRM
jgi:hypothetical protein